MVNFLGRRTLGADLPQTAMASFRARHSLGAGPSPAAMPEFISRRTLEADSTRALDDSGDLKESSDAARAILLPTAMFALVVLGLPHRCIGDVGS